MSTKIKLVDLTPENIATVTTQHIERFEGWIDFAKKNPQQRKFNVKESKRYLEIWQSIEKKNYDWKQLNQKERDEVMSALEEEND